MAGSTTVLRGNISGSYLLNVPLTPSAVGATTTVEQTFTVPGLNVGDFVNIVKPSVQPGLGIVNVRVTAANTLGIAFANVSTGTITPTAGETYTVGVDRAENYNLGLPANLA